MLEEIYLIRHAAPNRGLGVPYQVPPGPPLTEIGLREAAQAGAWLRERGVERLLASPFERTRQTAAAVSAAIGLPADFVEPLREGAPGEKLDAIRARMADLLAQLEDSPFRRVALVTHGAPIRGLLLHTTADRIDLKPHAYDNGNCAPTAGIWHGRRGDNCWKWELAFRPRLDTSGSS